MPLKLTEMRIKLDIQETVLSASTASPYFSFDISPILCLLQHLYTVIMPSFRNVSSNRQSGRLGKQIPLIYDKEGWPIPQSVDTSFRHIIKHEPVELAIPQITSPSHHASPNPCTAADPADLHKDNSPCVPSDASSLSPVEPAEPCLPSRRNSHTRRRDPSHIPRPRNAFIFFRSSYISSSLASGEGQQNELSKHAAKVWNKMTLNEKEPFVHLATLEKKEHQARYPNYVYSPGRVSAKSRIKAAVKRASEASPASTRKRRSSISVREEWSRSSATSSEPQSPEFSSPPPRPRRIPRAAAQRAVQRIVNLPSPSPSPRILPASDECMKTEPVDDDFVPNDDIPFLELTPKEEPKTEEHKFFVAERPLPLNCPPEQFGFKSYLPAAAISATLPPLPNCESNSLCSWSYNVCTTIQPQPPVVPLDLQFPPIDFPFFPSSEPKNELSITFSFTNDHVPQSTYFQHDMVGQSDSASMDESFDLCAEIPRLVSEYNNECMEYFHFDEFSLRT
ncbi:hypothetical protein BDZ97DRAFT_949827 [Flammula alnicola]|nr:hypothetical protein BDZ97DRAFT_949827 [Flammula alnicola]